MKITTFSQLKNNPWKSQFNFYSIDMSIVSNVIKHEFKCTETHYLSEYMSRVKYIDNLYTS